MDTTDAGRLPSDAEVLDAISELHAAGHKTISPMQVLEHLSPGYGEYSRTVDVDLVFPVVVSIYARAT